MTNEDINNLVLANNRMAFLLGFASVIIDTNETIPKEKREWFNKAIENAVYLNQPIPEMPK